MAHEDSVSVQWFGESWEAPVCRPDRHVETPDGPCARCGRRIQLGDKGLLIPFFDGEHPPTREPWHLLCFLIHVDSTETVARNPEAWGAKA